MSKSQARGAFSRVWRWAAAAVTLAHAGRLTPRGPERQTQLHARLPRLVALGLIAAFSLAFMLGRSETQASTTYTVNSTGDGADALINTVCETGAGNGICTLRAAIQEANAEGGPNTINFGIGSGVQTIAVSATALGELPTISDTVVVDGTTQPGCGTYPCIELDGTLAAGTGIGLTASSSTIKGLVINRFGDGIILTGNSNTISGNIIGADPTGMIDRGNSFQGIAVLRGDGNLIGGTSAADRNVVSGNDGWGIRVTGTPGDHSTGTLIYGNTIGLAGDGSTALGNGVLGGIAVSSFADGTQIGGTSAAFGNLISANGSHGITVSGTVAGIAIAGNYIGTDSSGTLDRGNSGDGVRVSGSGVTGVIVGSVLSGRNIISGNAGNGVNVTNASSATVRANYIGVQADGTSALANDGDGVRLENSNTNIIGGDPGDTPGFCNDTVLGCPLGLPPTRNIIAFNGANGIEVVSGTNNNLRANSVFSNTLLGVDIPPNGVTTTYNATVTSAIFSVIATLWPSCCTVATGYVTGAPPSTTFAVDVYISNSCSGSGFGEGATLGASSHFTTDANGNVSASGNVPTANTTGQYFTAMETWPGTGSTEFTNCMPILADLDSDGIDDAIDVSPGSYSTAFSDIPLGGGGTTSGTITALNGCVPSVVNQANPAGVVIGAVCGTGAGPMNLTVCGTVMHMPGKTSALVRCGSTEAVVYIGPVTEDLGTIVVTLPDGSSSIVTDLGGGNYSIQNTNKSASSITAGGLTIAVGQTVTVNDTDADGRVAQADNCPTVANANQANAEGDEYGDACEQPQCVTVINHWVAVNGDSDCDGYPDSVPGAPVMARAGESVIGTVAATKCSATPAGFDEPLPDAWPPDFNDNQLVNGQDILSFNGVFSQPTTNPPVTYGGSPVPVSRWDLNGSGLVNGADVLQLNSFFGKRCSP